jgi:hypothetical protein
MVPQYSFEPLASGKLVATLFSIPGYSATIATCLGIACLQTLPFWLAALWK